MVDSGLIVITAFISPFQSDRDKVKDLIGNNRFWEVFFDCPLEICEQRDLKGLYQKARKGEIPDLSGITSPYEPPLQPKLTLPTADLSIVKCTEIIIQKLIAEKIINHIH